MRQKVTWFIPGILLTLLLGLLWAMPAFAQDAGTISFLKGGKEINFISLNGFAANDGFIVQIEDQDLNVPTVYSDDDGGKARLRGGGNNAGGLDWTNLADMNNDGRVNINDIKVFNVLTGGREVARGQLALDVTNGTLSGSTDSQYLEFELNEKTDIGASLDSGGGDLTDIRLMETSATSGQFQTTVRICDSDDSSCAVAARNSLVILPVDKAGDTVTVRYSDDSPRTTRTRNISLDTGHPTFSNVAPASGAAGMNAEPDVSFDVVDAESGITGDNNDSESIRIIAGLFEADSDNDVPFRGPITLRRGDDLTVDAITDGFTTEARLREGTREGELDAGNNNQYEIRWWAVAVDQAGNTGVSDSNTETACDYSGKALGGGNEVMTLMAAECDPNVIRVDTASPELTSAETGVYLDDDKEKKGSRTSVVARFNEALDCDTVDADDFEVGGSNPNDVNCSGKNVYLSVDELDSDDTPAVEVAQGSIADRAGNLIGSDEEEKAEDGIPAGLTVTIAGTGDSDRPVTNASVTVTVSSDERLRARPMVRIKHVGTDYDLGADLGGTASPTGETNEWSFKGSITGSGLYNVYVEAEDRAGASSTKGVKSASFGPNTIGEGKALLFEVDTGIPAPKFTPGDGEDEDNAGVFIRANFADEGKEYGLEALTDKNDPKTDATDDDTREHTTMPGDVDTDFDTHGDLTLVEATFDGADVTDDVITRDNVLFVYRPGNLSNGEHTFEIEVEDNAGNEATFSTTFNKVDKAAYRINLNPGPNLVSFPADPVDNSIDAVFGAEEITQVLSYDNATGLWQTASKSGTGSLMGDLNTVNAMNGYWVVAEGVVSVSVLLSESGGVGQPPPHIEVSKGWNLIGVIDTDQSSAGNPISDYFANVDVQVVYGYDSFDSKLVRQSAEDNVATGAGYWVYANAAGIIIP